MSSSNSNSDRSFSHSSSSSSSSYLPESDDHLQIPPNGILLQYPDIDPTNFLNNPEIDYDYSYKDKVLDEKEGAALVTLLQQYKKLAIAAFDFNLNHIKFKLNTDALTQQDAFDALDKFYRDVRDVMPLTSGFLNEHTLAFFKEKQKMHDECSKFIEEYKDVSERCKNGGGCGIAIGIDMGCERDGDSDDDQSEKELKKKKEAKKKKKDKKDKKNQVKDHVKSDSDKEEEEERHHHQLYEEKKDGKDGKDGNTSSPPNVKKNKKRRGKRGGKGHSPKKEVPPLSSSSLPSAPSNEQAKPNFVETIVGISGVSSSLSPPSS